MNDRIQELAAEILRLRGEPARDDEHFTFAFVRQLFLAQMERAEKAEAACAEAVAGRAKAIGEADAMEEFLGSASRELAEAVAAERERCAKVCEEMANKARLSYVMTPDKPYIEEDLEKFAQLIIAHATECVRDVRG